MRKSQHSRHVVLAKTHRQRGCMALTPPPHGYPITIRTSLTAGVFLECRLRCRAERDHSFSSASCHSHSETYSVVESSPSTLRAHRSCGANAMSPPQHHFSFNQRCFPIQVTSCPTNRSPVLDAASWILARPVLHINQSQRRCKTQT